MKSRLIFATVAIGVVSVLVFLSSLLLWFPAVLAGEESTGMVRLDGQVWRWGYATAALATGLSSIAAAYAVATVGSAAMGVLAERPELFGRVVILVGLSEGIAIYGLIVSVLILNSLG